MTLSLRSYQRAAIDALYDYFGGNAGNPLVVMPTGTGKSVVIGGFIREAIAAYADTRVLALTHVKELTSQNFQALLRAWPEAPAGIYSAGLSRRDIHAHPEMGFHEHRTSNLVAQQLTAWGIEAVGSNRAMFQFAKKMFLNAVPMNIKGEKLVKAQPAIIRASQGGIWLPEDNAVPGFDVPGLLEELVRFTGQAGGQDDRADCIAQGCHMLPTLPTMRGAIGTPKAVSVLSAPRLPKPALPLPPPLS